MAQLPIKALATVDCPSWIVALPAFFQYRYEWAPNIFLDPAQIAAIG
jgi:hypothetical protein